jgi:hypothetical protein
VLFAAQEYTIRVDNSKLTWIVYRRYSQFEALHAAVCSSSLKLSATIYSDANSGFN